MGREGSAMRAFNGELWELSLSLAEIRSVRTSLRHQPTGFRDNSSQ